jgi:hypothetical protein
VDGPEDWAVRKRPADVCCKKARMVDGFAPEKNIKKSVERSVAAVRKSTRKAGIP